MLQLNVKIDMNNCINRRKYTNIFYKSLIHSYKIVWAILGCYIINVENKCYN